MPRLILAPARLAALLCLVASLIPVAHAEITAEIMPRFRRGQPLFLAHCALCHQPTGRGSGNTYPPLAGSDFLTAPGGRTNAIRAVTQGLGGPLTVSGRAFNNQMPAVVLSDAQVADVLTYVFNAWGNSGAGFTPEEVAAVRATTAFPTYEDLVRANAYPPVPPAPAGVTVRELVRLNEFAVRIASDGKGDRLYLLGQDGAVSRLDVAAKRVTRLFAAADYVDSSRGGPSTLGFLLDARRRLWIVCNQRNESGQPYITNEVTIFRTTAQSPAGDPIAPKPWFHTSYPFGIGPYNHGVSHLAIGPDGALYVSSGSRTDGGETGQDPRLGPMRETELTACLWRFADPEAANPVPEVVARGIRNAWSFQWDGDGNLFTVSNGPDAHAGEEMDWIRPPKSGEAPRHHGFPYQFEDWPVSRKAYPHTPEAPGGVTFVPPVVNLGPDGVPGGGPGRTFHPHSSPAGMVWLDSRWPEPWRSTFLVGRFGNLLPGPGGDDAGFDVLSLKMERQPGGEGWNARTHTFLAPLGRPIDLHLAGGRLYVLEYTRPTNFREKRGWLPGRILEVVPSAP